MTQCPFYTLMNIITKIPTRFFGYRRIVVERKLKYKQGSIDLQNWQGQPIEIRAYNKIHWAKVRPQFNPPIHDFIDFRKMTGNEILINLQNHEYLRRPELIGGLSALGKIKQQENHNWNTHPFTTGCFEELKKMFGQMKRKELVEVVQVMDRLRIKSPELWGKVAANILRIMHDLRSKDYYYLLDLFHKPMDPKQTSGEDILISKSRQKSILPVQSKTSHKTSKRSWPGRMVSVKILGVQNLNLTFGGKHNQRIGPQFFQRLVAMLPIHLKNLSATQITRLHQVCTERNIGSQELYEEFFYFYMEKYCERFSNQDYLSNLLSMARRGYQHDEDFWDTIYLPVIYERAYNERDAADLRDGLIFLKLSCPFIVVKNVIQYLEDIAQKFKLIKGYQWLGEAEKDEIKLRGTVPETEKARIRKRVLLKEMSNKLEDEDVFTGTVQDPFEIEEDEEKKREKREKKKLKIKMRREKANFE